MKAKIQIYLLAVTLLGSTVMLNSCGKSDDNPDTEDPDPTENPPKTNFVSAKIDTKVLDPIGPPIVNFESTGNLDFTVNDKDQITQLNLFFNVNDGNSLTFGTGNTYANLSISSKTEGAYVAKSGTLTLTTNDKTEKIIEGTFSFTGENTIAETLEVTEGKFYIKY